LLIAYTAAIGLDNTNFSALILLAFLVAFAAALAKGIHYMLTFFVSGHLSEKNRKKLDTKASKVKRWAFLLLYVAAATPIPDEPIVIPLGLLKYSPTKFFTSYFLGKITITVAGVFLGSWVEANFSGLLNPLEMVAISIALTIIITVIMFKVDMGKIAEKILKKYKIRKQSTLEIV
jgi:membrane protein DedA with SNARE-associated domain